MNFVCGTPDNNSPRISFTNKNFEISYTLVIFELIEVKVCCFAKYIHHMISLDHLLSNDAGIKFFNIDTVISELKQQK